nr:OsmC family peroxiredoxin [Saprospiraceae bacterium]
MKRSATSTWTGPGVKGSGHLTTGSGEIQNQPYSFKGRFEEGQPGTNPDELAAAAHAGCFNMALAVELEKKDYRAEELNTKAVVHLNKVDGGFEIEEIDLNLKAHINGIGREEFMEIANGAKENCPISKLYKGAKINLNVDFN